MSADPDEASLAWAYLSRVVEPPSAAVAELVAECGPVEAAARVKGGVVSRAEARRAVDEAARDLDVLRNRGGRLITPDEDEWPHLAFAGFNGFTAGDLKKKPEGRAPLVLWALGPAHLDEVTMRSAAIVGTRACTPYGEHVAADLAAGLVERDVAVISGGAYGIDGVAHRATLSGDGVTVAVLAGGIDIPYPSGHSALLHRIAASGLLITEYPPGVRPARHRFLTRNRLVAALSGATVVVEAGLRSGAANTAAWAKMLGRVVCAVPGPVTSAASAGTHELLRGEAILVTRAAEIVEIVGRAGELADGPAHPVTPLDGLGEAESLVYEALPGRGVRTVEQIAIASGLVPEQVLAPLAMLEIAGLVRREDGCWGIVRQVT
ncbi:DNA-processing protein DprA [Mycolicibacterium komossense]|uniref:DNA-protecting protein DprA n=1 Tax=Mycolicibacterium komossense TaxID=1779 RepID=A0ABT3CGU2_9MYCO|nr:DNA-processing protein DprA [Mycolicibacterium komossense]MCV7228683.1 DNA-protecting protein DprA [Mycolicibacterium komossense]